MRSRILRWREFPGLSRWVQCNHKDPYGRGRRVTVGELGYTSRGHRGYSEDARRGYKPEIEAGRVNETDSSSEPLGRCSPVDTLMSAQ